MEDNKPVGIADVVDLNSRRPTVTPKKLRAAIQGQYQESKTLDHSPEQFFQALERRVFADMAYAAADFVKGAFADTFGDTNGRH